MQAEQLRPDPDRLLEEISAQPRGKLKIFFGACAGVGKTYAMLQEAQRLHEQGLDILVGIVETHGRKETAALLNGLKILPLQRIHYRSRILKEFDLDSALAKKPAVILIDELAHTNASGSRHPKRWQDVEELLDAGIDVLTTVNVQHLESLNDVVGGVTGITVRETVPDPIFDGADEIVLVDLPPDDLLIRLNEGKVYLPAQAERAIEHFFRKGNLIALRELALRRTTDRVDEQMRVWRERIGEEKVWHTRDAILVCIGDGQGNEKLVRAAARLAGKLGSQWHAVYVETPALHRLSDAHRRAILDALNLAQQLGEVTATLAEPDEEKALIRYAREHNLGKVVFGRRTKRFLWQRASLAHRLNKHAPELDILMVALDDKQVISPSAKIAADNLSFFDKRRIEIIGCLTAALLCSAITVFASLKVINFDNANLVMLYILAVVVIARFYGRWPSVFASIINVISFDLFIINPRGTLAVSDMQYLITFSVMLTVGLVIGNLTAGVRYQAKIARYREQRTRHLYEMSKALASGRNAKDIATISEHFISNSFQSRCQLVLPDESGDLRPLVNQSSSNNQTEIQWDEAIARWSFDKGLPAGAGTDTLPSVPYQILPLQTADNVQGLVIIEPVNRRHLLIPEQQRLLETLTLLVATALERLALTASEEQAHLFSEREQLRNSLLAALSHDLRTPLTVLSAQTEILTRDLNAEGSKLALKANEIRQHIISTTRLVNNLLDMARIQSGGFKINKEWLTIEEVVGSALQMLAPRFDTRIIALDLEYPLTLIHIDGLLFERVLINLIENAVKYAGITAKIGIRSRLLATGLEIEVWDNGLGIPEGKERLIFDKFSRGQKESAIPGVGLGLAICQAIMDLHDGDIYAVNRNEGGASFHIRLPYEEPPEIDEMHDIL